MESSGKSEISDSLTSEGKQKILNFGFDISPEEISGEKKNSGSNTSDTLTSDDLKPDTLTSDDTKAKNTSSLPEPSEKGASAGPEPMACTASPEFSKQKELTNSEPVIRKVTELKPADLEVDSHRSF